MWRSTWLIRVVCVLVGGLFLIIVGTFFRQSQAPITPPAPVVDRTCVAVHINLATGITTESPVPCRTDTTAGCTGTITAKVEDDGAVTTTCR